MRAERRVETNTLSTADLARLPLFTSLSSDELRDAAQLFTVRYYPKGAILASEGDRLDVFSIVLSGEVKFFWLDEGGRQLDIGIVGPGEDFAAQTFGGEPILTSVIALDELRLASVPLAAFERLLLQHSQLAVAYLKRVVGLMRNNMSFRRSFAMEDVYGRVTQLLLASAVQTDGMLVTERLTHSEIGQRISATREMVGRILRDLARGGYIEVHKGRIVILRTLPRHW
jgi:CRP/FNR family transcriptional regulator, cyclic AMP receptor protein